MIIDFDEVIVKEYNVSASPYWGNDMMEMQITLLVNKDAIVDSSGPLELKFIRNATKRKDEYDESYYAAKRRLIEGLFK